MLADVLRRFTMSSIKAKKLYDRGDEGVPLVASQETPPSGSPSFESDHILITATASSTGRDFVLSTVDPVEDLYEYDGIYVEYSLINLGSGSSTINGQINVWTTSPIWSTTRERGLTTTNTHGVGVTGHIGFFETMNGPTGLYPGWKFPSTVSSSRVFALYRLWLVKFT